MKNTILTLSGLAVGGLLIAGVVLAPTIYASNWGRAQTVNAPYSGYARQTGLHNSGVQSVITSAPLSTEEKSLLTYQYQEEMVARDLYSYFATLYPDAVFRNIAQSEQQHMDAVKSLLDGYSLPVPTGYGELQSIFGSLKSLGETGQQQALEAGIQVEIRDIQDIAKTVQPTDNVSIKTVLTNIGGASYNHLRGFLRALEADGYTATIDTSAYLSPSDLSSRGSLQYKLSDQIGQANGTAISGGHREQGKGRWNR